MKEYRLPIQLRVLRKLPLPRKLGLLERLFGKDLAPNGICWVSTANGVKWKLDLSDSTQRWIVYGDYEGPVQMNWIRNWLSKGGNVIDSGANIGQMCLYMAPLPNVRVFCFEPLPEAYEWTKKCLSCYPDWNVSLNQFGLSDQRTMITVQVWGSRTTARMDWYVGRNYKKVDIKVISLDEFASNSKIDTIRLWKLDVEGHESAALRGAKQLLERKQIEAILVEISSDDIVPFLFDLGYSVFEIGDKGALLPIKAANVRGNYIALAPQ
jgi:FkbM family methyltransferase